MVNVMVRTKLTQSLGKAPEIYIVVLANFIGRTHH